METLTNFKQEMSNHGINPPEEIITDDTIHRFKTCDDRSGETSGAYWHNGRCGWFQDWRTMEKPVMVNGSATKMDLEAMNRSFSGNANRESHEKMLKKAHRIWNSASDEIDHAYMKRKKIEPPPGPPGIRQYKSQIIIPLHDMDKNWNGLQRIYTDGSKWFLKGTSKKGSFFTIRGSNDRIVICEGFATGVSIYQATRASVAVAFDARNLKPVAEAISSKGLYKEIIIAGDNDFWKEATGMENIGEKAAKEAAKAIGCKVAIPVFENPDGKKTTDFNDLLVLEGPEVVNAQIEATIRL